MAALHKTVSDLHDACLLDKQTMRHFDERCLTPIPDLSHDEIKASCGVHLKQQHRAVSTLGILVLKYFLTIHDI